MIKALIVDDSTLIRAVLAELLSSDPDIEVVGSAIDPLMAREKIKALNPDVITLDIEMPHMDGITFLANIMRLRPMPVVMISAYTQSGAPKTLEALQLGAIDFIAKPKLDTQDELRDYREEIISIVKAAAKANVRAIAPPDKKLSPRGKVLLPPASKQIKSTFLLAFGASTGGTEALRDTLCQLPKDGPPVLVVQHIPKAFSTAFAERLNSICPATVYEAYHGQKIEQGGIYLGPGDQHLTIKKEGSSFSCQLDLKAKVNRHRPSVEVLFDSVLKEIGSNAAFALLTGMGTDGAEALLRAKQAGCYTIAQDEKTSLVWGMPGHAVKIGAASTVLPLSRIPARLLYQAYQ